MKEWKMCLMGLEGARRWDEKELGGGMRRRDEDVSIQMRCS